MKKFMLVCNERKEQNYEALKTENYKIINFYIILGPQTSNSKLSCKFVCTGGDSIFSRNIPID